MVDAHVVRARFADEKPAVLLVDDDAMLCRSLHSGFIHHGWDVATAESCRAAGSAAAMVGPDVAIVDLALPDGSGFDVIARLQQLDPDMAFIIVSGFADVPATVQALQLGAETVLEKPVAFDVLFTAAQRAATNARLRRRHRISQLHPGALDSLEALGHCEHMRQVARELLTFAPGRTAVLLQGETGTGKGYAARLLHQLSPRAHGPFVELNCAALAPSLLESELFGHERGAFTDARSAKRGLMELADGGTLFLDEITELKSDVQPKLLKAIDELRFRRVGGVEEHRVDVRIVLAGNSDLDAEVKAGRFRTDLFYRLVDCTITIPPLRARATGEITRLVQMFLGEEQRQLGRGPVRLSEGAMNALVSHAWPGNVRELRSVIATAMLRAINDEAIDERHLRLGQSAYVAGSQGEVVDNALSLREIERRHIVRVLVRTGGNRMRAARILGITRTTLYKKLADYELDGMGTS